MNSHLNNLDSDLAFTLRNLRRNLGGDHSVLAWLREDYKAKRALLVERGYGTVESLDEEAARYAASAHGAIDPATHAISPIVKGLRLHSGLGLAQAEHEASDTSLAD